jgi:hypothetical protein
MTTGRINQVTVRSARRPPRARRTRPSTRTSPEKGWNALRPEYVTFCLLRAAPDLRRQAASPRTPQGDATVPSPPISQASEALPGLHRTRVSPFPGDDTRTAALCASAAGTRRIPYRLLAIALAHWQSIHIPRHLQQKATKGLCQTVLRPKGGRTPPRVGQAAVLSPFPSGFILHGRRIDRSVLGGPAHPQSIPSLRARRAAASRGSASGALAESTPPRKIAEAVSRRATLGPPRFRKASGNCISDRRQPRAPATAEPGEAVPRNPSRSSHSPKPPHHQAALSAAEPATPSYGRRGLH